MKVMQFFDLTLSVANLAGAMIGLYVMSESQTPGVGVIMLIVSAAGVFRMGLTTIECYRDSKLVDVLFGLIYAFGIYEGLMWCGAGGELFGLGIIIVCLGCGDCMRLLDGYIED